MTFRYLPFIVLIAFIAACRPKAPVPKPTGYYKIDLPEHEYRSFDSVGFPFSFDYPVYGEITQDSDLAKREQAPYWINIHFPRFDATIYLSYKSISRDVSFDNLIEESYRLSFAHDIRADYIRTPHFETANGLYGIIYEVGGNAASPYQFFISDTVRHFIRGSLYFDVAPNADSLKPVSEFLKKDIRNVIETFRFKE